MRLDLLRAAGYLVRRPARELRPGSRPWRILIIRPDHLGDVLMTTPLYRALQQALPSASVDWLVGPWASEVVERFAPPDALLLCDFPGFTRRPKRPLWSPYLLLWRERARLLARRYDVAVVARPDHWWGALLATVARIPIRIGYEVPECGPFLTHALPVRRARHQVDESLALGRVVARLLAPGTSLPTWWPTFPVRPDERQWADQRLRAWELGDRPLVVVHPGSGARVKNWIDRRWRVAIDRIAERLGAAVVLTGSQAEAPLLERVAAEATSPPRVLAGQTTVGQLAALLERAALALGGDSGPLHLAAAVGTPTVRLFGPTDPARFGPWERSVRHRVLVAGLACQPCGDLVAPPCHATDTPPCLEALRVEDVVSAALEAARLR